MVCSGAFCPGWWGMDQVRDLQGGWDMDWVAEPRGWGSMKRSPAGSRLQVSLVPSRISFGTRAIWYLLIVWMVVSGVILISLFGRYQVVQCSSHHSVGPGEVAWHRRSLVWPTEEKCEILPQGWSCHVQQYRLARRQFSKEEPWTQVDELLSVGSQWQRPATYWTVLVKAQPAAIK